MATLQDFLAVHNNNEGDVFNTLAANADKRGTKEESKLARGGVDPSVWAWYDQKLAAGGGNLDTVIKSNNAASQAQLKTDVSTGKLTPEGLTPAEVEKNKVGDAAYQQKLAQQPQQQQQLATTPQVPVSNYTGPSVVDYLNSIGQPSDKLSRQRLAQQMGIQNYDYSATKNTELLSALRAGKPPSASSLSSSPTAQTGQPSEQTTATGKSPMQNIIDTWTSVASQLGLGDIKKQYEKTVDEQKKLQDDLNDKIADINDNPWLSEGLRVKQVESLKGRYETKLNTLSNYAKLYDALFQEGQQQARFLVGEINDSMDKALEIATKKQEAIDKLKEINPANFKEVQGGLYDISTGTWVVQPKVDDGGKGEDIDKLLTPSEAAALGVPYGTTRREAFGASPVKNEKVNQSKTNLLNALTKYSDLLGKESAIKLRFDPSVVAQANSLKSQITAEYKTLNQLGTLDVGVQKLIDGLLGGGGVASFSPSAQKASVDSLIQNLKGSQDGTGTTNNPKVNSYLEALGY